LLNCSENKEESKFFLEKRMNSIKDLNLKNKRVFLRADLNVPIENKKILQDYRLEKILPTINYIIKNGGKVILATHIGRPQAKSITNYFNESLSTQILLPWFKSKNYEIQYEADLESAKIYSNEDFEKILLLENLRFFNGEQGSLKEQELFAKKLKELADIYINDAFALTHRDDCSVTLLPKLFKENGTGLLIEEEIKNLQKIKDDPKKPFLLVLGGKKIETKISLLKSLINKPEGRPTSIIIGGLIADIFLNAKKENSQEEKVANEILNLADKNNVKIILPIDKNKNDIGQKTVNIFCEEIKKAKTIFVNGTMGVYEQKESQKGTFEILKCIAESNSYKVAGGGDAVGAIYMFNFQDKFNYLSTGGGATFAFLANEKLNII
jgi:phosphoglycerate kinase